MKDQLNLSIQNLVDKLLAWFDSLILNLPNIILAIIVFFIAFSLSKKISARITKLLVSRVKQASIRSLIGSVISVVIVILGILLALSILNLDQALNSLITGAGVAGLAIGLAVQGTLSNTFAGISLSLKDDINIDDFIETNGFAGTVVDISLRDTKLRTIDNNFVIIPNNSISSNPYKNFGLTTKGIVRLECGIGYDSDLRKVEEITREVIAKSFPPNQDEVIDFNYLSFGESAINFEVRFWIPSKDKRGLIIAKSQAIILLKEAFDKESITIPFPIRTIINKEVRQVMAKS